MASMNEHLMEELEAAFPHGFVLTGVSKDGVARIYQSPENEEFASILALIYEMNFRVIEGEISIQQRRLCDDPDREEHG